MDTQGRADVCGRGRLGRGRAAAVRWGGAVGLALLAFAIGGCFERVERGVLNPDGSGRVTLETDVAVPTNAPGKEKPDAVAYGRELTANLINQSRGVDAWSDVTIKESPGGRVRLSATAWVPDISRAHFDLPLSFTWGAEKNGAMAFGVERTRSVPTETPKLNDAELADVVAKAQAQYKEQQLALRTTLAAFTLKMTFTLPGEVTGTQIFARNGRDVSVNFDGTKLADALDKFMADGAAIGATIKSGQDLTSNDDFLLEAMYGVKGPIKATFTVPAGAAPAFDYRARAMAAQARQADVLKAAGVELVPRFTVKPPATGPGR